MFEDLRSERWWDKYCQKWRLYPHLILMPENGGLRCDFCALFLPPDQDGSVPLEQADGTGCTERKDACRWCGETPLCAPNCAGMRLLLSDPKVYVTGENPFQ